MFGASGWPARIRDGSHIRGVQELLDKIFKIFAQLANSAIENQRANPGEFVASLQAEQLFEIVGNPVPAGAQQRNLITADDVHLRAALWPARFASSAGTIVLCQGRSEFIEKYFEVIEEFLQRGFTVVAFDWRGQGGSERQLPNPRKGHVDHFKAFWSDIAAIKDNILAPDCPRPWAALGHSMGGAILLDMAGAGDATFDRLILTAPMIDLYAVRNPKTARFLAAALNILGLGGRYAPGGGDTFGNTLPFSGNLLTSDPRRYARAGEILTQYPQIGLGHPTVGWIHAAFQVMDKLMQPEFPRRTYTPILILGAGADHVIRMEAIEAFAHRLKAGKLIVLPHCEHEILVERDPFRAQFWAAVDAFLPNANS